jgi:RNA polymerase sigma-70 factor, ECF subfamily
MSDRGEPSRVARRRELPVSGDSEDEFVPQAKHFDELYAQHFRPLVAHCRRILAGAADPEEVAQEAFVKAWRSFDSYLPDRPFWPWLITIARRVCVDEIRHARTVAGAERREAARASGLAMATPESAVELEDEHRLALAAIATLKPEQRRVIGLRHLEGRSYEDIAESDGVSVESVRASLRRARQRLREAYLRLEGSAPSVVIPEPFRRLRRRIGLWAQRAILRVRRASPSPSTAAKVSLVAVPVVAGLLVVPLTAGTRSSPSKSSAPSARSVALTLAGPTSPAGVGSANPSPGLSPQARPPAPATTPSTPKPPSPRTLLALDSAGPSVRVTHDRRPAPPLVCLFGPLNTCVNRPVPPVPEPHLAPVP